MCTQPLVALESDTSGVQGLTQVKQTHTSLMCQPDGSYKHCWLSSMLLAVHFLPGSKSAREAGVQSENCVESHLDRGSTVTGLDRTTLDPTSLSSGTPHNQGLGIASFTFCFLGFLAFFLVLDILLL